jgi:hypothetical protein
MRRSLAGLLVVLALTGCAQPESRSHATGLCPCPTDVPVVDATLLAFLSKARASHHEADLAEAGGDPHRAIAALDALVSGPRPGGAAPHPEVAEVIADTRARLADLRSAGGQFDAAEADVVDGLRLTPTPTHFRGHLIEVRGVVEQRRSTALKEQGDMVGAERAKQAAIRSFEESMEVNDEVITRALGDAAAPGAR